MKKTITALLLATSASNSFGSGAGEIHSEISKLSDLEERLISESSSELNRLSAAKEGSFNSLDRITTCTQKAQESIRSFEALWTTYTIANYVDSGLGRHVTSRQLEKFRESMLQQFNRSAQYLKNITPEMHPPSAKTACEELSDTIEQSSQTIKNLKTIWQ